jgi:hypothetical protein
MEQQSFIIHFENVSDADASFYTEELKEFLLDATSDIIVKRERTNNLNQDLGQALVVTLAASAPVIATIAQVIIDWNRRRHDASVSITTKKGYQKIELRNVHQNNAVDLAREMVRLSASEMQDEGNK